MKNQLSFDSLFLEHTPAAIDETNDSSAQFPWRFVLDVDRFLNYCAGANVSLTKTSQTLGRKHLQALDTLLSVQAENANAYSSQEFYPYIDFIFRLTRSCRLIDVVASDANSILQMTDRFSSFRRFNNAEKYCTLLETMWVDMDWDDFTNGRTNNASLTYLAVFDTLRQTKSDMKFSLTHPKTEIEELLNLETHDWQHLLQYFEWLGLWVCEPDFEKIQKHYRKNAYFATTISVTEIGKQMMSILLFERNLQVWNRPLRRLHGQNEWLSGAPLDYMVDTDLSKKDAKRLHKIASDDQSQQPFYLPFRIVFPDSKLENALPRAQKSIQKGSYTFRVTYSRDSWRIIKLPGVCTMHDLHNEIVAAYAFDDDHLYSFFMDKKKWSNHCIVSPDDYSWHPDASKSRIDSIGLLEKQQFLYLFDYGEEWTFHVRLEEIYEDNTDYFKPYVVDGSGTGPVQYEDWE